MKLGEEDWGQEPARKGREICRRRETGCGKLEKYGNIAQHCITAPSSLRLPCKLRI